MRAKIAGACAAFSFLLIFLGLTGCDLFSLIFGKVSADAGQDQTVTVGAFVTLDGTRSRDSKGGTSLRYAWAFSSTPPNSSRALSIASADNVAAYFTPDTDGVYIVRLTVSEGTLSASATVKITATQAIPAPGTPGAPAGLAVGGATVTSLTISWSAVSDATSYQVFRDRSSVGPFSKLAYAGSATSFTDNWLASGGTYFYKVRGTNANGSGFLSSAVAGTVTLSEIMPIAGSGAFTYSLDLGSNAKNVYFVFSNPTTSAASAPLVNGSRVQLQGTFASDRTSAANAQGFGLKDRPDPTGFNTNPFRFLSPQRSSKAIVAPQQPALDGIEDVRSFMDTSTTDLITATCRKIVQDTGAGGTGRTVFIWVANDCWYQGGTNKTYFVTPEMVDAVGNAFLSTAAGNDDVYDWVTNIYGAEYGSHNSARLIPPNSQITIVLYDIDGDNSTNGGVIGFFWSKDEFLASSSIPNSNQRVMFYLDAVLLATPDAPPNWHRGDHWPSDCISALAHELQHMIHFYQKTVLLAGWSGTDTWIDEMASMVTEDLVADKLHLDGPRGIIDDPTAGNPNNSDGRLPYYNYCDSYSLSNWGNPDIKASYAIAYAFGAYLARNFGGAPLFRDIVLNSRTDSTAIDDALSRSASGPSETFSGVFWKWGVSNLLSDRIAAPAGFAYNRGGFFSSAVGNTSYNLGSINLYNYTYHDTYHDQIGPSLWTSSSAGAGSQQMTSNLLFGAGNALTGLHSWQVQLPASVTLTVVLK